MNSHAASPIPLPPPPKKKQTKKNWESKSRYLYILGKSFLKDKNLMCNVLDEDIQNMKQTLLFINIIT